MFQVLKSLKYNIHGVDNNIILYDNNETKHLMMFTGIITLFVVIKEKHNTFFSHIVFFEFLNTN